MQSKKQSYHKGNVRENLIKAAGTVLQEEGLAAMSLRRVARDVGVAPSAVYNHFPNREALLVAVAADGYRQLAAIEQTHFAKGGDPAAIIRKLAREYLIFATRNPELYRLVFSAEIVRHRSDPELDEAGDTSFALSVEWWYGAGKYDPSKSAVNYPYALSLWSILHGLALQMIDGLVTIDLEDSRAIRRLADTITDIYLEGAAAALPKSA